MAITIEEFHTAWANQVIRAERAEARVKELESQLAALRPPSKIKPFVRLPDDENKFVQPDDKKEGA